MYICSGHAVRVQPPMEELRVQHYHQLRRLVSMPAHFVGVQNNITDKQTIFASIVAKLVKHKFCSKFQYGFKYKKKIL